MEDRPDAETARRLRDRDPATWSRLIADHRDALVSMAYRSGMPMPDAEDLAQETLVRAYAAARRYRATGSLRGWLFRIELNLIRNRARDAARHAQVRDPDSIAGATVRAGMREGREVARQAEATEVVSAAVASLSERERTVIILREYEGLSYDEIARVLGCRRGTVKSRLHRAREALARRLAPARDEGLFE